MASSSGVRCAARSRCIEERKSSWTVAISSSVASASAGAPSARATAAASRTALTSAGPQRGSARTSPSDFPAALVTVLSATRRVSLVHSAAASSAPTSAGMPAARRSAATGSSCARRPASALASSTRRNGLVCTTSPGPTRSDSTRIERRHGAVAEALAQHGEVVEAVEQRDDELGLDLDPLQRRAERGRLGGDEQRVHGLVEAARDVRAGGEVAQAHAAHAQALARDRLRGLVARDHGDRHARARQRAAHEPADAAGTEDGVGAHARQASGGARVARARPGSGCRAGPPPPWPRAAPARTAPGAGGHTRAGGRGRPRGGG